MDGPDSDRDAMFIFDQPALAHKTLGNEVDTIHTEKYDVDFHGWNLRKFASLLSDSNPQALDFLNSEIQYHTAEPKHAISEQLEDLRLYANRNFNPIRLYMHNRSKAKSNYEKYVLRKLIGQNGESGQYIIEGETDEKYEVTPKGEDANPYNSIGKNNVGDGEKFRLATTDRTIRRNLKVIQVVLYARHIRRSKSLPQMDFEEFLEHSVDSTIQERVMDLLEMKRKGEGDMEAGNPFEDLIESEINYDVDHQNLNQAGIDREIVNQFILDIDGLLYR